jgi:hypothetical protein
MQPPPNRPGIPPPPPRPGGGLQPPPGYQPRPAGPARPLEMPAAPAVSPQLAAQAHAALRPPVRRPSRGFLRFFAGACISSAWLTLILSIVLGIASIGSIAGIKGMTDSLGGYVNQRSSQGLGGASGLPTGDLGGDGLGGDGLGTSGLGLPEGGGGGPALGVMGMLAQLGGALTLVAYIGAAITFLSGVVMWLLFLGLGKLTHAFLDLEEQAAHDRDALQAVLAVR